MDKQTEKVYLVSESVLQGLLNYLGTRPYKESYKLINAIQSSKPLRDEQKNEKNEEKGS